MQGLSNFNLIITPNFHNFCSKYIPPLSEFSHCFCPNFGEKQWEIRAKAMGKLGKSNEKTRKAAAYISGKNYCFCPNFPLLFPEFPIAFPPNFPLLFPEFPIALARISHCFCPNFPLLFARIFWGAQCPPAPPPPPASYAWLNTALPLRLWRSWSCPRCCSDAFNCFTMHSCYDSTSA